MKDKKRIYRLHRMIQIQERDISPAALARRTSVSSSMDELSNFKKKKKKTIELIMNPTSVQLFVTTQRSPPSRSHPKTSLIIGSTLNPSPQS